jgi:pseudo-rSAM protein
MKSYWFYLEPYTIASLKKNGILLYNCLSGKLIDINKKYASIELLRRLIESKNKIIKINYSEFSYKENIHVLGLIKKYFMGGIVATDFSKKRPQLIYPIVYIKNTKRNQIKTYGKFYGKDILRSLNEMTIYLNSGINEENFIPLFAHKQFISTETIKEKTQIKIEQLLDLFNSIEKSSICKINITGSNILKYPNIEEVLDILDRMKYPKSFYFDYRQIISDKVLFNRLFVERYSTASGLPNTNIEILVSSPVQKNILLGIIKILNNTHINYNFIVETISDVKNSIKICSNYSIMDFTLLPYYNKNNKHFFEENVFINKNELIKKNQSLKDIIIKETINPLDFGKITVYSNGNVYANLNNTKLGNLKNDSIYQIILKEVDNGKSWFRLRKDLQPCKMCKYNILCPPISNYEYVIKKNNLCKIYEYNDAKTKTK